MEMTERSEEDVCCALYECDNDLDRAVIFLLEQLPVGAFATTSKKKKNKSKEENAAGDSEKDSWNNENAAPNTDGREKGRNRQGGIVSNGSKNAFGGGRGGPRDRKGRDDRNGNVSDFKVDTFRSDRGTDRDKGRLPKRDGGGGYVPGGGRGGRGGRANPGGTRSNFRENRSRNNEHQEIDSWDASQGIVAEKQKEVTIDTWGDWDNEEYTGSLTDTKVFTPSTSVAPTAGNQSIVSDLSAPPGLEQQLSAPVQQIDSYSSAISGNSNNVSNTSQSQYSDLHSGSPATQQLRQALELPQMQSTTLSAEQSQYFNTLSSQGGGAPQYNTSFGANQYGVNDHAAQQRSRRARVPPPSKIPSSAVEMPGDNLSNIGYLDVQFGGLDFGTDDSSFDQVADKFRETSLDASHSLSAAEVVDYQSKASNQGSALSSSALQASQLLSNADNISHSDSISSRNVNGPSANNAAFSLNKPESYISQSNTAVNYQSGGGGGGGGGTFSSSNAAKIPSYQQTVHNTYGASSFSSAQGGSYTPVSNTSYNSFNQNAGGSFQPSNVAASTGATSNNNGGQTSGNSASQTHSSR